MTRLMFLDVFDRNPFGTNCWIVGHEESGEAIVVDPGYDPEGIRGTLERAGKRPVAVLLTHAHLDHASAAGAFAGEEIPVFLHAEDAVAYDDIDRWDPGFENPLTPVKDLRAIVEGGTLRFAGLSILVHHTPGHTPGHCSFEFGTALAGGDLVFAGTIGRSDFPNSSPGDMERSLRWFLTLDDGVEVLPGHGERTTVGRERASNPFLAGLG